MNSKVATDLYKLALSATTGVVFVEERPNKWYVWVTGALEPVGEALPSLWAGKQIVIRRIRTEEIIHSLCS